jgi:small subunit ribosomal protein S2
MPLPSFTMRQLLEAGVHFGHHTRRWQPKMAPYIFGVRSGVHIIDLEQTVPLLERGLLAIRDVVAGGGRVLFVGTKRQAAEKIAESGARCGQYYVNHRWLGGMLTNWKTISNSIKRLRDLDQRLVDEHSQLLPKKELLRITRERNKLERALGGIKEMNKEAIAVAEANKLAIPVVAVIDSNCEPDGITYPIPGNDDAMRAINLYCDLVADAVLDGLQEELRASGVDVGASEEAPPESLPAPPGAEAAAAEQPAPERSADAPSSEPSPEAAAATEPAREPGPGAPSTEPPPADAEEEPATGGAT